MFCSYLLPWSTCQLVAVWKFVLKEILKKKKIFFFPKSKKTLLGCHLLQIQPGGNESRGKREPDRLSSRLRGSGRSISLLCLMSFSLRVPSASSNSASDSQTPAPWELFSDPKSISRAVNHTRPPELLGAAFLDWGFPERPRAASSQQLTWLSLKFANSHD